MAKDPHTPVERLLGRKRVDQAGEGRPLTERAQQRQRTLESYFMGSSPPRWMERLKEIEHAMTAHRQRLARAHRALREECADDPERFAERWALRARAWDFRELNELIAEHNEWYPVERRLAMDPRTRDYVPVNGRSYRRPLLGTDWILEHFPAV